MERRGVPRGAPETVAAAPQGVRTWVQSVGDFQLALVAAGQQPLLIPQAGHATGRGGPLGGEGGGEALAVAAGIKTQGAGRKQSGVCKH